VNKCILSGAVGELQLNKQQKNSEPVTTKRDHGKAVNEISTHKKHSNTGVSLQLQNDDKSDKLNLTSNEYDEINLSQ
jgi:hypothetical protein